MSHILVTTAPLARRSLLAGAAAGACLVARPALAANAQQEMVDDATKTIVSFSGEGAHPDFSKQLHDSVAVLIVPRLIKAGFIIGGEGGGGVMLVREKPADGWSPPAFYSLASASIGLQAGAQSAETVMLVRSRKALDRLMSDKVKLGADAGLAVATIGAGLEGSTTTAAGADILAFARAKGLYGGISFEGSVLAADAEANHAYYGVAATPRQILFERKADNRGTAQLRARLDAAAT
ncbi:MAG: lipid-binding SYLF domain-containing protein [Alphaproteobacteria bacterium]|nr:lipid-binding SYLF domain-containing protein [Alphaproteobacteria bacterium]